MKKRRQPTDEQLLRRLNRFPVEAKDRRRFRDAYVMLRLAGWPHAFAKHAFRDEPPKIRIDVSEACPTEFADIDPDELLVTPGSPIITYQVTIRPELDEEIAKTAPPRRTEYTIPHRGIAGFGLRVRTSGHRSYIFQCRIKGRQRKFTIGSPWLVSFEDALLIARSARIDASAGIEPCIEPVR